MIKSSKDNRYAIDSVVTHDGTRYPCWALPDLLSFKQKLGAEAYEKVSFFIISKYFRGFKLASTRLLVVKDSNISHNLRES